LWSATTVSLHAMTYEAASERNAEAFSHRTPHWFGITKSRTNPKIKNGNSYTIKLFTEKRKVDE
ncbi:MAG: hypothetical protein KAJ05_08615, partial [Candidatus Latescibacteria bacterium]|nr:hypothetical protein [Candidatus Latescibacterota bacterium]